MERTLKMLITLFIVVISEITYSQGKTSSDSVAMWVRTRDGNEYVGFIEIRNSAEIQLRTTNMGTVTIPVDQIKKIREIDPKDVDRLFPDFYSAYKTKYYTIPSARMLKKGEGYYQNGILLNNLAAYGITDHWSVGIGTFIPLAAWISTKAGFSLTEGIHIAGNVSIGSQLEEGPASIGLFTGMVTLGKDRFQATLGAGVLLEDGIIQNRAAFQFGALFQTGPRGYIIFEGNVLHSEEFFDRTYIFGGRTRVRRVAIDYGMGFIDDNSDFIFLYPYVGVLVPF